MDYGQKSKAFWDFLEKTNLPGTTSDAILFNQKCHEKAEELKMEPIHMNRVVTAWACTLSTVMPKQLWNEPKGFNNG